MTDHAAVPPPPGTAPRQLLLPQLVWEALLGLLLVAALIAGTVHWHVLRGPGLAATIAMLLLLGGALVLSLRTATPNLAVGIVMSVAALAYLRGLRAGWAVPVALLVVLALALVVGLVMAVLTGPLGLPGWAVSLAAVALLTAYVFGTQGRPETARPDQLWSAGTMDVVAVLVGLGTVAAGVLWQVTGVRRALSGNRAAAVPAGLGARTVGALVGMVGSTMLAALAGVVFTGYAGFAVTDNGSGRLVQALAVALLAGASVRGGRGPLAGTVLAAVLLALLDRITVLAGLSIGPRTLITGLALLLGLLAGAAIDLVNRYAGRTPAVPPAYQPAG